MITYERIADAFGWREKPEPVTSPVHSQPSPETLEADWFAGRDWRDVTRDEWDAHADAVYSFTPVAFQYYFPSLVLRSLENLDAWFAPADAIVTVLDRSPNPDYWDEFLTSRFAELTLGEYEVILEWLVALAGHNCVSTSVGLGRAFDTVELLALKSKQKAASAR